MTSTRSDDDGAGDAPHPAAGGVPTVDEIRAGVLRRPGLVGERLRRELTAAYDGWLADRFDAAVAAAGGAGSVALVAVGGLGRCEPAPYSDLDLVLLHSGRVPGLQRIADAIWYPIWDSGVGLDHSVRTPEQALQIAGDDVKAVLGLLDLRHVAGDAGLSGAVREGVLRTWRATAARRLEQLREIAAARWRAAGEAAFLLEPNLKDSRGGLRDTHVLRCLARAQLVDLPPGVEAARQLLLDVRAELERTTGSDSDVLRQQEQPAVAAALDRPDEDGGPSLLARIRDSPTGRSDTRLDPADLVLRAVNEAARTVALATDNAARRIAAAHRPPAGRLARLNPLRRGAPSPTERVGLATNVVAQDGEVVLARDADPWADPLLTLRAAHAAARADLPLAPFALERLATESAPVPRPWPTAARDEFVALLGTGARAVPVLESLDQAGLLVGLLPEWDAVRSLAQHNPVHRFTVDRHLLETAAQATDLVRTVARPDLLLLGALLHDIGKGFVGERYGRDHSVVGAVIAERMCHRMGLSFGDAATVTALVRHHLLLPDTATRRDADDPRTISIVTEAVAGSGELLDLLHALTVADALATGPLVWSDWKSGLVERLVRRTRSVLGGAALPGTPELDDRRRTLAEAGELAVVVDGEEVVVAARDGRGVLSRTAGVLALHSLDVRSASIRTHAGMAVNSFVVSPRFGSMPEPTRVRQDLSRALSGALPLAERLQAKERSYARGDAPARRPPVFQWFDDEATDATIMELRADDAIGLLFRVTAALERSGVDVRSARLSSLGGAVVDAFYLTTSDGRHVPAGERPDIEQALAGV